MNKGFQKAITNGINFLARGQEKDGSFFCLVSTKLDDYKNANMTPAIVPTNIVLSSLAHISESDKATRIKQKAAKFLLGEKGQYWSFNYWFRKSDWFKIEPYPDDTDDTFCALAALYEYNPKLFDGEVMAKIVTMLTSCEEKEGGPYDMWLVPPSGRKKWRNIDLVCNSNIAYFLSLQDISLPNPDAFIDTSIDEKDYEFPYNKIYPGIYFISRFYQGKKKKKMIDLLLKNQETDGKWENPLRTALAISSLINLEGRARRKQLEKGIAYLVKTQNKDGGWEPSSFYFSIHTKEKTLYAGSPFITTALCLEAIHKFSPAKIPERNLGGQANPKSQKESEIYDKVIENYRRRFSGFSKYFQEKAVAEALKILNKNKDIVLLPYYFAKSLGRNFNSKFLIHNSDLLIRLGEANLHGWIAYTIYDDFLDEEGDSKHLSIANVCLRESAEIFGSVAPKTGFPAFSKNIFDIIDGANMWEIMNCRFDPKKGDYLPAKILHSKTWAGEQLANKSLGHALGPMAVLFALGYGENSAEARGAMRFFKNYIIARQLNDDAHDWEDDLRRGQVNAVGARLLKDTQNKTRDFEKLRQVFWHKTIVSVCKEILRHTALAKKELKKLSLIKDPAVFMEMLAAIESSAEEALKEREETMKFLKTYNPDG